MIPGVGYTLAKRLISHIGSLSGIFSESIQNLQKIQGISEKLSHEIQNSVAIERAENEMKFIANNNITATFYLDKSYPMYLRQCPDAPLIIYTKGEINFTGQKFISIVGTRKSTAEGRENANKFVGALAEMGMKPVIVSGLAYGIDIAAHKAALENSLPTIAVFAHGLHYVYPSAHRETAAEIVEKGGVLLSEFPSRVGAERRNFLQRNRIIAGLSDVTIIVESDLKGGAMNTIEIANSYSRDTFAFPGRLSDKSSRGCNLLIKRHKAQLIESANDLVKCMSWDVKAQKKVEQLKISFDDLTEQESTIIQLLHEESSMDIDTLCYRCKIQISKLSVLMFNLECKGLIRTLPGKVYTLA